MSSLPAGSQIGFRGGPDAAGLVRARSEHADLAARIRSIDDPERTFPLLVPSSDGQVEPTRVQGVAGSMLNGSGRYGTGIAWLKDGFVVAVSGSGPLGELKAAAEGAE